MTAAVLYRPHDLRLEELPVPSPGVGEVLVQVRSVGVCGSDVHYFEHGRIGDFVVEEPLVLGHETSGMIVAIGPEVSSERIGQRVSLEPGIACGHCTHCRAGRYNLCASMRFHGTPPVNGTLAEFVSHPSELAFEVPSSLSDNAAALLEPLSVAVYATQKARVTSGDSVLVAGAGPVGLLVSQMSLVAGATRVTISDIAEERLAVALGLGVNEAVLPGDKSPVGSFDAFIDCSGSPTAIWEGTLRVRPAGRVILVGMGPEELRLPFHRIQQRQLNVASIFRYANTWPTAIALASSGRIRLDELVTQQFPLSAVEQALTAGADPRHIKAVVRMGAST